MSKETAVDWLVKKVSSKEWQDMYIWHKEEVFKEAKKIFKEQIIDAWMATDNELQRLAAEKYYKENYENDNKP